MSWLQRSSKMSHERKKLILADLKHPLFGMKFESLSIQIVCLIANKNRCIRDKTICICHSPNNVHCFHYITFANGAQLV